ncbi:hypothetical protein ACIOWF_05135 [Cellulosimicrobium cellulans]|uniref:hypothetical protein n=1 Tax=Cellulosimicrobium cellulans TaxID=1710 RepID=UPI00382273DA
MAALAFSKPTPNGHVVFQTGDLRAALYTVDFSTGEYSEIPSHRQVQRYVADAVKGGLLATGSTVRCLRLPTGVDIGTLGRRREDTRCPVCGPSESW